MADKWMKDGFIPGLFSVIVPTFNRAHSIAETLDSVKVQTYRPIEVIVIDDGSTDDTRQIVNYWSERNLENDSLDLCYFYQENAGVSTARNFGLRECHGEYIQFLDSDDLLHEERFARIAHAFQTKSCDLVATGFGIMSDELEIPTEMQYGRDDEDVVIGLLDGSFWPNVLRPAYSRDLVQMTGPFNTAMSYAEDYEYLIRALIRNPKPKTASLREILAYLRIHQRGRRSDTKWTKVGLEWRVYCNGLLCNLVKQCDYITHEQKGTLASRLYLMGAHLKARGWYEFGNHCGEMAAGLGAKLDTKGIGKYLAWRGGAIGYWAYRTMIEWIKLLTRKNILRLSNMKFSIAKE